MGCGNYFYSFFPWCFDRLVSESLYRMFVKKERYKFVSDGNTIFYNFEALFEILGIIIICNFKRLFIS